MSSIVLQNGQSDLSLLPSNCVFPLSHIQAHRTFFSAFLYCTNLLPGFQRPQNEIGQEIKPPQSKKPEQNKEALTGEDGWLV